MNALSFSPRLFAGANPEELFRHVEEHKYLVNQTIPHEISLAEAHDSWLQLVYLPLANAMSDLNLAKAFPEVGPGELFLWVSRHWHHMKRGGSLDISPRQAVIDFGARFARDALTRFGFFMKKAAA